MTKADFSYGTLTIAEYQGKMGTIFTFADSDQSNAPSPYDNLPEADAALIETDEDVVFRRLATVVEEESILSMIDEDPDYVDVYTDSTMEGFRVETTDISSESNETLQSTTYQVSGNFFKNFDSREREVPRDIADRLGSAIAVERVDESRLEEEFRDDIESGEVSTQFIDIPTNPRRVLRDLIIDWAESNIAGFMAEQVFDECGTICVNCIDHVWSLIDCTSCRLVCSTGASPQGAVVCLLCVYMWCGQDPLSTTECVTCADCIITGEVSANPRQDIYESFPDPVEPPSWLSL